MGGLRHEEAQSKGGPRIKVAVMVKNAPTSGRAFKVVCAWCGVVIRRDARKEAERMCAGCFRRMMDGYTRPLQQAHDLKASRR